MTPTLEKTRAQTSTEMVVSVDHLRVRYGDTLAVDDVSLSINRGEIFGILGPNGAGKTTTVECIGGLRRPDGGSISVLGLDALQQPPGAAPARRDPAAGLRAARQAARRGGARSVRLLLRRPRRPRPAAEAARPRGQARRSLRQPVRRPAPAAVDRAGARRPARAGHPRRADHRPGPAVAPRDLEADRGHPRRGRDGDPRHPLHGGGRAPVRSPRAPAPRARDHDRHAGGAGRGLDRAPAHQLPSLRGGRRGASARAARRPRCGPPRRSLHRGGHRRPRRRRDGGARAGRRRPAARPGSSSPRSTTRSSPSPPMPTPSPPNMPSRLQEESR